MELDPITSVLLDAIRKACPEGWWANPLDFFRVHADPDGPSLEICVYAKDFIRHPEGRPGLDFLVKVVEGRLMLKLGRSEDNFVAEEIADLTHPRAIVELKRAVKRVCGAYEPVLEIRRIKKGLANQ
jgi:hypothetical protein